LSGKKPLNVQFLDRSTNSPTSWRWTFGDGTTSTLKNPLHTYRINGNFTVTLRATNSHGSNTLTVPEYIKVTVDNPSLLPVVRFTASPLSGVSPLFVHFTDQSTGTLSRTWSFGDGSISRYTNPTHVYINPGTYSVSLTETNTYGSATLTKANYIVLT